jgi:hypothetical protein
MRASDTVSTSYRKIDSPGPWTLLWEPPRKTGACPGGEVLEICIPGTDMGTAIRELIGDGTTAVSILRTNQRDALSRR